MVRVRSGHNCFRLNSIADRITSVHINLVFSWNLFGFKTVFYWFDLVLSSVSVYVEFEYNLICLLRVRVMSGSAKFRVQVKCGSASLEFWSSSDKTYLAF